MPRAWQGGNLWSSYIHAIAFILLSELVGRGLIIQTTNQQNSRRTSSGRVEHFIAASTRRISCSLHIGSLVPL